MKKTSLLIVALGQFFFTQAQQLRIQYLENGNPYAVSAHLEMENDNDLKMENGHSIHEINFAYFGSEQGDKTMSMMVRFTENVKREIPAGSMVIVKLGNGEILGTRTLSSHSGVFKGDNVYASTFQVYFNNDTARKIASNGIRKVRLAYDRKKLDWHTDEDSSQLLALGVVNTDLTAFAR